MAEDATAQPVFTEQASEIVAAYVAHNSVPLAEVPNLIRTVHDALAGLDKPAAAPAQAEPLKPPVPIRKSVTDEHIISLEDGKPYKTLKRHLAGRGMTPADYRAKWGLPGDYPLVAPAYAARRSALAKTTGLGRRAMGAIGSAPAAEEAPQPEPEAAAPAPKRGRAKKAA